MSRASSLELHVIPRGRDLVLATGRPQRLAWANLDELVLEIAGGSAREPSGAVSAPSPTPSAPGVPAAPAAGVASISAPDLAPSPTWKTRRTHLVDAVLSIPLPPLSAAIAHGSFEAFGIRGLELWTHRGQFRLSGRVVAQGREAPFSIDVPVLRSATTPRLVRLGFADVRLYDLLPVAAPMVGVAVAKAFAAAGPPTGSWTLRGPLLEVDLLELALVPALVADGWRLPRMDDVELVATEASADVLRLRFAARRFENGDHAENGAARARRDDEDSEDSPLRATAAVETETDDSNAGDGADRPKAAPAQRPGPRVTAPDVARATPEERVIDAITVAGAPLATRFLAAESHLVGGHLDLAAAAFRGRLAEDPMDRTALLRLIDVLLATAATGANDGGEAAAREAAQLASAARERWPDLVHGWVAGALAALAQGARGRAAALFTHAAELARRSGDEPAALLSQAASHAADSLPPELHDAQELRRFAQDYESNRRVEAAAAAYLQLVEHDPAAVGDLLRIVEALRQAGLLDRAAALVDRLLAFQPDSEEAWTTAIDLAVQRQAWSDADALFARRLTLTGDPHALALLVAERARIRLLGPGGASSALAILRELPLPLAPEEGLVLRADLAERVGDLVDARQVLTELLSRARVAGDRDRERETSARLASLADAEPGSGPRESPLVAAAPSAVVDERALLDAMAGLYDREPDVERRARALDALIDGVDELTRAERANAYGGLAAMAEARGDFARAAETFMRAGAAAQSAPLKARFTTAHGRVLLAQGRPTDAEKALQAALALDPRQAEALALLANRAFETRNWARALLLYNELASLSDAASVIPRELLVLRRAFLARGAGDLVLAESCYREAAVLNPRHVEARQALADIAAARQDHRTAAQRLEEVARLLPPDAIDHLLAVRQRLADLYVALGEWEQARHCLELVLAQVPMRREALDRLVEVYLRLGLDHRAARTCELLSRLEENPSRRAELLHRQGDILRGAGDDQAAFDAYLKASDLNPGFAPTTEQLIRSFWAQGLLADVLDVADGYRRAAGNPALAPATLVRVELAAALLGRTRIRLGAPRWEPPVAAEALLELVEGPSGGLNDADLLRGLEAALAGLPGPDFGASADTNQAPGPRETLRRALASAPAGAARLLVLLGPP